MCKPFSQHYLIVFCSGVQPDIHTLSLPLPFLNLSLAYSYGIFGIRFTSLVAPSKSYNDPMKKYQSLYNRGRKRKKKWTKAYERKTVDKLRCEGHIKHGVYVCVYMCWEQTIRLLLHTARASWALLKLHAKTSNESYIAHILCTF